MLYAVTVTTVTIALYALIARMAWRAVSKRADKLK
jgi:hypothetical protein